MANEFDAMKDGIKQGILNAMNDAGNQIADGMKQKLQAAGHVDTGALLDSIHQETMEEGSKVVTYVYANAKSSNGAQYAEFIEMGTGAAHGRAGGREGYWRYKDRNGEWHTTDGMDADPFIEPTVDEVMPELNEIIEDAIAEIDIAKYGR